jgi:uncharacterized protein (TIGR01777 family)
MKIVITGGTGFVGCNLSQFLLAAGWQVIATGTSSPPKQLEQDRFRFVAADTTKQGDWQETLQDADAVINLAGRTIFNYWTQRYKQQIFDSRILTTRNLVSALPENKQMVFISASACGFYGDRGDTLLSESSSSGHDFLAEVCQAWENEAYGAQRKKGIRTAITRFGVVLDKSGGAIEKMMTPFRFFLGGPLGNGRQWFPWIHLTDLIAAIQFILENPEIDGPINFVAPEPIRYGGFAKTLGRALKRPAIMPAPAFVLKTVMGGFGASLLASQRIVPEKLLKYGFTFQYPDLEHAIDEIVAI